MGCRVAIPAFFLVKTMRIVLLFALLLIAPWFAPTAIRADQKLDSLYPPAEGTTDPGLIAPPQARLKQIQQLFQQRNLPLPPALNFDEDGIACLLESPYLAQFNTGRQQQRFLSGRLVILNQSPREVSFPVKEVRLRTNGQQFAVGEHQDQIRYASLQLNGQRYSLSELKPAETLTVPPGGVASSWVVFNGLDAGSDIPSLSLHWPLGEKSIELDLRLQHEALLGWQRERIGPAGIIAIGTIHGELNTINLGTIFDDVVALATDNVARVVIQFDEQAKPVEPHLMQWFFEIARRAGVDNQNLQMGEFPALPSMIRELHLVAVQGDPPQRSPQGPLRVHQTLAEAVLAAGGSAYEVIPMKMLLEELRGGHPLSRCAALRYGAIRLPASVLPEVIQLARSMPDEATPHASDIQQSAIFALSEFNDPRAVASLVELARSPEESTSSLALTSLGASRFPSHQHELMQLLDSPPELQQRVIRTLARFPRRLWAETLYEYALTQDVSLRVEAIRALNVIGHPQLNRLLETLLDEDQPAPLRELGLELLSQRDDPHSREQVITHALQRLKTAPDTQALNVVTRFKVQQSLPILLNLLQTETPLRLNIIQALNVIGDERVLKDLISIYPKLNPQEQTAVLRTIAQIDPARFLEFSREALKSDNLQVVSTTAQLLQEFASVDAVDVLIEALGRHPADESKITSLTQALGNLSTPESRRFLIELRDNGSQIQQQRARTALESLYYRSPANHIHQQAAQTARSDNKALAIEQFTLAIAADPTFPHALQGRAEAYAALLKHEEALADYSRLLELDPHWPNAQGARGQTLTALGRFQEALPDLTRAIEQDPRNPNWFSARGHAYSMLEKFDPAEADYRKALELNPRFMTAITGVALSLAIRGDLDAAMAMLQEGRADHADNAIFAYNSACTYARAAEFLQQQNPTADTSKQKIIKLVEAALDELERSIELGYKDADWTRSDPDLKMLREHKRFAKALETMADKSEQDAPKTSPLKREDAGTPKP